MKRFFNFIQQSFRAQLIYGIGLFLTVLLSVFIYIETKENNNYIRERSLQIASDHSKALASMVKVWVMSNDYIGLEEALENFSVYNDLVFATVINMDGKIIAHTDKSLIGKYVADKRTVSFLQKAQQDKEHNSELFKNRHSIDVIRVIHNMDHHIGFVYLRFDQHLSDELIHQRISHGIGFGLLYLTSTILLLYVLVNMFSKQLGSLLQTMKKVHEGDKTVKADEGGYNELSELSGEFNSMIDSIASAETALKAVKEQLEYAISGTQDGLWDWDLLTNEVYFSPRWKEMLGYTDSELPNVFKTWEERVHPDDIESTIADVALCRSEEGQLFSKIYRMRHKSGSWIWILGRAQTVFNTEGKAIRMAGFHTDITKQKELEEKLFEKEEMMIVQSRHAAMGEMIGMIAHQWRQPLTAISTTVMSLSIEQALDTLNAQKLEKALGNIENYTQHLSKTISDFSNFFKNDKIAIAITLNQLIEDSLDIISPILASHNIILVNEYLCEEEITTYPNEFKQVLLNIFKNAQDVVEEKKIAEPTITIKTYKENNKYCISIEDNAGGIPDTIINKIFEPYFTTKESLNGTGLGLYMSKIIIHEHCNGTIEVKNTDNGALFIIRVNGSVEK